eukprot:gene45401-55552_t
MRGAVVVDEDAGVAGLGGIPRAGRAVAEERLAGEAFPFHAVGAGGDADLLGHVVVGAGVKHHEAAVADADAGGLDAFLLPRERGREDRHQFRFIVSPEDAEQLDDLRIYTRHLMARMEAELGTRLDWVAVDHWNTDNPHTHVVLRGKDDTGKDLIISRDYIAEGMRRRAAELATEWLGPRTELEIQRAMQREVNQERWTGLDRTL